MNKLENARARINEIDAEMASLWTKRMEAVREVSDFKRENGLKVLDSARESALLEKNSEAVPEQLKGYYAEFLRGVIGVSKRYQRDRAEACDGLIRLELGDRSYDILVRRGELKNAAKHLDLERKALIVTDDGVPPEYAEILAEQCAEGYIVTLPQGEKTKNLDSFKLLLKNMLEKRFTRKDCVIAVGGGVIGDLAGFAAAAYMRGIDFYNVPTTTLSQIDSSIGGKVAVDLDGFKNTVGAFWQPKFVLIDPDVLSTLDPRQTACGLAEAVKMALCFDKELFERFESFEPGDRLDDIIASSLKIKKAVVEQDETESGLRKVLNFGHTIGHGIETAENGRLFHGECVALGMLPMCSEEVRERLKKVLSKLGLPLEISADPEKIKAAVLHDKKSQKGGVSAVKVNEVGKFEIENMTFEQLFDLLDNYLREAKK